MLRPVRFVLGCCLLLSSFGGTACGGRWRPQQAGDVAGLSDPNATYALTLQTLKSRKYSVLSQDAATRTVTVRAHNGEGDAENVNVITLRVDAATVHVSAKGYLVHRDGSTHRSLNAELSGLRQALQAKLGQGRSAAAGGSTALTSSDAPPALRVPENLPVAWSEPAYDPAVWGRGNFTCLPVKLADEEQAQLTLKLSNGETADVLLSLAHAPELCRSPKECTLKGGCPALGIADPERVSRLATRLSKHEIGPLATLFAHGQPVATIDLTQHGSIAQAMTEKH